MANDLALVSTCALGVLGLVFTVFAVVAVSFKMDPALAWIFGPVGIGLWLLSATIFVSFLTRPRPRDDESR